jgi:hypothetical protein
MDRRALEEQVFRFEQCIRAFAASAAALDETLFLGEVNDWTPRDIVAHLVGWNRHMVRGAKQILRGELPFYDVDPGPNFSKVNAAIVSEYDDTDCSVLLRKLSETAGELKAFLQTIDPADWDRDFGVRHEGEGLSVEFTAGEVVTVKGSVDDLIADYDYHRAQLEELRTRRRSTQPET